MHILGVSTGSYIYNMDEERGLKEKGIEFLKQIVFNTVLCHGMGVLLWMGKGLKARDAGSLG